jgi:hypothetical protein
MIMEADVQVLIEGSFHTPATFRKGGQSKTEEAPRIGEVVWIAEIILIDEHRKIGHPSSWTWRLSKIGETAWDGGAARIEEISCSCNRKETKRQEAGGKNDFASSLLRSAPIAYRRAVQSCKSCLTNSGPPSS